MRPFLVFLVVDLVTVDSEGLVMLDVMSEVLDMEEDLEDSMMKEVDGLLMEDMEGLVTEGLRGLPTEHLAGLVRDDLEGLATEDLAEGLTMPAVFFTAITTRRGLGKSVAVVYAADKRACARRVSSRMIQRGDRCTARRTVGEEQCAVAGRVARSRVACLGS